VEEGRALLPSNLLLVAVQLEHSHTDQLHQQLEYAFLGMAPNVSTWPLKAVERDAAVILISVYCTMIPEKITKFAYSFRFSFDLKKCLNLE
jgi:hypothetical protein